MVRHILIAPACALFFIVQIATTLGDSPKSLVAHSNNEESGYEHDPTAVSTTVPKIYQMHVKANIRNRYAHTTVISKVMNLATKAEEAVFSVVLPETAFISGFIMEVDGKNYTAHVKEKEEAKKLYDAAVARGSGAAHVEVSARNSNHFSISVNVEPETKAAFYLTYEELLKRQDGHYELLINLHPGQPVKDLSAEVAIEETRKIIDLKAPPIRSGNEIGNDKTELDPRVKWVTVSDTSAVVMFSPDLKRQLELARLLGTAESTGFAGQFVVQYDVERDPAGGEVLIGDGYFVHFFAPSNLTPLSKYVVFVLDTSSSMSDHKIMQLKEAMHKILEQLHSNDLFSLVEFNTNVKVWDINSPESSVWYPSSNSYGAKKESSLENIIFPPGYIANADNIKKASAIISLLQATAATNIHSALEVALYLTKLTNMHKKVFINRQPLVMFLTDGQPSAGETSLKRIINDVSNVFNNNPGRIPIFSLSFGDGADKHFLQKLSLRNSGFSKHIYEAADAALQLQHFYKQISSPLLSNVTFKYASDNANLTNTDFPMYFSGSELVVTGWCGKQDYKIKPPVVDAWNGHDYIAFQPTVQQSVTSMERLWAYLTIKQLLEKMDVASDDETKIILKKKALDLALKYSFVTSVSSLVVVKPDNTNSIDGDVNARDFNRYGPNYGNGGYQVGMNIITLFIVTVMELM